MRNGFVVSTTDMEQLRHRILSKLTDEPVLCSSPVEIIKLQDADFVYFVVSEITLGSTAYQSLVFTVFDTGKQPNWRLLCLDKTAIPLGFSLLLSLPEGAPG